MDPMIIGTTVPFLNGATFTVYSVWMPSQGDVVRLTVELIDGVDTKLVVQTKNMEDTDASASDLANVQADSNPLTVRATGVKELVRCKLIVNPVPEVFGFDTGHLRCLDPQWEFNQ